MEDAFLGHNGRFSYILRLHYLYNVTHQDLVKKDLWPCWFLTSLKPPRTPNGCVCSTLIAPLHIPVFVKFTFISLLLCNILLGKPSPRNLSMYFPYVIWRSFLVSFYYYVYLFISVNELYCRKCVKTKVIEYACLRISNPNDRGGIDFNAVGYMWFLN